MWLPLLIYAVVTILLALVDHIRRDKEMGKVANIDHKVSVRLAGLSFTALWLIFYVTNPFWWFMLYGAILGVGCLGVRFLLFDPFVNLFNREKFDHVSTSTNSYKDQHTNHLPFWGARGIGLVLLAASLTINYLLK